MKIHNKLFLVLFGFSLLLVTALVLLMQWSIGKGMIEYVNKKEVEALSPVVTKLASEYQQDQSWSSMQGEHKKLINLLFSTLKDTAFMLPEPIASFRMPPHNNIRQERSHAPTGFRDPPRRKGGGPSSDVFRAPPPDVDIPPISHKPDGDNVSYVLFDSDNNLIAGFFDENVEHSQTPILVNGINVGWLLTPKHDQITDGYELDFIEQQQNYLWIIALVSMGLVALITLPLARHLVEPIKLVMSGMHHLTQGNFKQNIDLKRKDELGELSLYFNDLAVTLYTNEAARKRWLANISHELRTPVAILRGELEAMLDEVRPINKSNIDSANDEVKHLQHLVDDLQQLTSAEIGGMNCRKQNIDFSEWLNCESKKYSAYLQDKHIDLALEIPTAEIIMCADTTRLSQLFNNQINNCIKYSKASFVKISVKMDNVAKPTAVTITVEDNGVGVDEKHLANLFEHLYRVESSRNRKTGGSGLGLSICAHIVTVHGGSITAEQSALGGLAIVVKLPLSK